MAPHFGAAIGLSVGRHFTPSEDADGTKRELRTLDYEFVIKMAHFFEKGAILPEEGQILVVLANGWKAQPVRRIFAKQIIALLETLHYGSSGSDDNADLLAFADVYIKCLTSPSKAGHESPDEDNHLACEWRFTIKVDLDKDDDNLLAYTRIEEFVNSSKSMVLDYYQQISFLNKWFQENLKP